jgi:hypothetical protein
VGLRMPHSPSGKTNARGQARGREVDESVQGRALDRVGKVVADLEKAVIQVGIRQGSPSQPGGEAEIDNSAESFKTQSLVDSVSAGLLKAVHVVERLESMAASGAGITSPHAQPQSSALARTLPRATIDWQPKAERRQRAASHEPFTPFRQPKTQQQPSPRRPILTFRERAGNRPVVEGASAPSSSPRVHGYSRRRRPSAEEQAGRGNQGSLVPSNAGDRYHELGRESTDVPVHSVTGGFSNPPAAFFGVSRWQHSGSRDMIVRSHVVEHAYRTACSVDSGDTYQA